MQLVALVVAYFRSATWWHWVTLGASIVGAAVTAYVAQKGAPLIVAGVSVLPIVIAVTGTLTSSVAAREPLASKLAARRLARAQQRHTPTDPHAHHPHGPPPAPPA